MHLTRLIASSVKQNNETQHGSWAQLANSSPLVLIAGKACCRGGSLADNLNSIGLLSRVMKINNVTQECGYSHPLMEKNASLNKSPKSSRSAVSIL
uniref:Secreted protein n=1 Tax=Steinernema glaseri TaxID=37863 RepID=A0A1I7YTE9_9BILA